MSAPAIQSVEKPLLAFHVSDDENATIVFARHAVVARREGANELNAEFECVSCRREKWADRYAEAGSVPAAACVARGWWFEECVGCGRRISEDELAERRLSSKDVIGTQGGAIFCCKTCKARDDRRRRRQKRIGDQALATMRAKVLRRFPGVQFVTGAWREHVYVTEDQGFDVVRQVVVSFDFPGQKIGPASLRWDGRPSYLTSWGGRRVPYGPPAAEFMCCQGDIEAFNAFVASSPLPAPSSVERVG